MLLKRRRSLVRKSVARGLARSAGRRIRSAARWLVAVIRAIKAAPFRSDYRRRLIAFATELAGRCRPWELAALLRADVTAGVLDVATRSVGRYRAELTGLGYLLTFEEGSTPAVRASYRHRPTSEDAGNLAAVLLFTSPLTTELSTLSSSVEEDSGEGEPTREGSTEPAAPAQPRLNPRDRRGRSRVLAGRLVDLVPELEAVSVAAVATVLRQHRVDHWGLDDLRLALRFRPGWEPWLREHEAVRRPAGWLAYRLRAWAGGLAPAALRRALERDRNPAGVQRRQREAEELRAAPAAPPAEWSERAAEIRGRKAALREAERARDAEARARRHAWLLSVLPDPENPWPATR